MNAVNRVVRLLLPLCLVAVAFARQAESPTLERARQRWERLSPDDQARYRDRYERYQALGEDERRGLAERARRVHEAKERLRATLSEEMRAKLDGLEPRQRETVINELVQNELRARGARIREKLPADVVERLERARPEERGRILFACQKETREKFAGEAIGRLGRKLGLPEAEIERLKSLPGPERVAAALELGKQSSMREVNESGLPPGVSAAQWNELSALPPNEFFERVRHHHHEHDWRGGGLDHRDKDGREFRRGGPPSLPRELMEALRPSAEDVLRYADLPADERRARIFELRRGRVIAMLAERKMCDEQRLAELGTLDEGALYRRLRELFPRSERPGERRGGRGGPPPDGGDGREPRDPPPPPRDP